MPRGCVFYPEVSDRRCTAALLLEVEPVAPVRGKGPGGPDGFSLAQYVNDRPYAASSVLAVALGRAFRTATAGRCDARPELPEWTLPLEIHVPALLGRGGVEVAVRLFGRWVGRYRRLRHRWTRPCQHGASPSMSICGCPDRCG